MRDFQQFDNVNRVIDDLKVSLASSSRISIEAATFSIYAYQALKDELEKIDDFRFIFTSPTFIKDKVKKEKREFYIPKMDRERTLYGSEFEIRLRNQLTQKAIAKECADWIRRKCKFRSNISNQPMNTFMNIREGASTYNYIPFNEFTTTELGSEKGDSLNPNKVGVPLAPETDQQLRNFNDLWNDSEKLQDVTDFVLENIETVYRENPPDFIYFVTLYNIFKEFLEDLNEDLLPKEGTGFRNSRIWNMLYNFQKDAALAIINKLEKYNGCILADSVGLGKTYTALAVIKYFEARNRTVLVLCPKKLNDNWQTFKHNYDNNPVYEDRFRYEVLFHSDLSRDDGYSNSVDLARFNWSSYDLVVIDESHNFRNGGKFDYEETEEDEKQNRYVTLMRKVIQQGVKTKVLMLSATPVNNRFNDLKNQLQLAYEGNPENINDKLDTSTDIESVFRMAQKAYNQWSELPTEERTTDNLLNALNVDFFKVLDAVTIARSRNHIVKYYDTKDIGEFPERLPAISRRPSITTQPGVITVSQIAEALNRLNLAVYTPTFFILDSARERYENEEGRSKKLDQFGREKGLRKLMAINLLKRLESSIYAFRLTLQKIQEQIRTQIDKVKQFENHKNVNLDLGDLTKQFDFGDDDVDFIGKFNIDLHDMDYISWRRNMEEDLAELESLLKALAPITVENDNKLKTLYEDIRNKVEHPINPGNKKILVFTAFADTAEYIFNSIAEKVLNEFGMNVGLVTGTTDGKTTIPKFKCDFNRTLTCFSPVSKDRDILIKNPKDRYDIDLLIATDCISEGQNLQDCDWLINYDVHWNPVRIIQRFGRIDRIGSKNKTIQLTNYWPDMELDDYIDLKDRVESRMKATILTASGDENPLSAKEKGDLEYRRNQMKKIFQGNVFDLEDVDGGISIMDLGLNEFRLDLLSYIKERPDMDLTPHGMNAVVRSSDLVKPACIFILKNRTDGINIDRQNRLHPFYMVFVSHEGEILCDYLNPKKLLDIMRHACKGKTAYDKELCRAFNKETHDGKKMDHYSDLLQRAIDSIIHVKEESEIDSLFSDGETTALKATIKGLDDFELISFLVVK